MHSITLRFMASHNDGIHASGKVSGGTVLRWVDDAGLACAMGWAKGPCVTALVSGAQFAHPVLVGDLVEVLAKVAYTGTTSMGITLEVYRCALPGSPMQQVLRCSTVYVAVDAEDRPRPVDSWSPETPGDMALAEHVRAHINTVRTG